MLRNQEILKIITQDELKDFGDLSATRRDIAQH